MSGAIVFNGGHWAWIGVALAAVGILWTLGSARRHGKRARLPAALRVVALALLALCLAEPSWVGEEAEPGANLVAVIADNSTGMQVADAGESGTRAEALLEALTEPAGADAEWLAAVESTFALRRFAMDRGLRRIDQFRELDFRGQASSIGASLRSFKRRFEGQPVAAVVMLTDGNSTDEVDLEALRDLPPVFPVVMGGEAPERDLAVRSAAVSESAFEDAPLTFRAEVSARGHRGREVTVRLRDGAGGEVETLRFTPESEDEQRAVRFEHRPEGSGVLFYRIEVEGGGDREATELNNARRLTVNRGRGPYRVLYVSGRPNWEFKFLSRALADDSEVEMAGLIRVAKREPRFQWRARRGETANPLFRGFNPDDDTAEYDQPVLVRLNTRDKEELAAGFPRDAESLFRYRAVILDDLERDFFTMDQLDLLEAFVSRRGGSLLMLGGMESFAHGGYDNTPVERLLPVHPGPPLATPPGRELKLELTRDGWLSPWMRLRPSEGEERDRLGGMGAFKSLNRVAGIKPGATVLAQVDDRGTRRPALAVQRYGSGRTGAMMIGDFWRWGFADPDHHDDMEKAWRQLVRWLLSDVAERMALELEAVGEGAVKASVRVLDPGFEPLGDAEVSVSVQTDGKEPVELAASPSDTEPGVFEVTFLPEAEGMTHVQASARDGDEILVGEAEEGWVANGAADEFRRLEANRALLEEIAQRTGGRVLEADELPSFAGKLPRMEMPEMRTWSRSLWHTPWVFLLVLACFAGEWIARRRSGMA